MLYGLIGVGLILTGLLSGAAMNAKGWMTFGGDDGNKVPIYIAADPRVADQVTLNSGFASVAKAVTPAVVTVQTSSRTRPQQFPFFSDPFGPFGTDPFRDFFFRRGRPEDDGQQTPRRQTPGQRQAPDNRGRLQPSGLGSGVIVSPESRPRWRAR
jgi:S1-C subfamily serine protease